MRRDIVLGMVISGILHGGFAGLGFLFPGEIYVKPLPVDEILMPYAPKMPEPEPETDPDKDAEDLKDRRLFDPPPIAPERPVPARDDHPIEQPPIPVPVTDNHLPTGLIAIPAGPYRAGNEAIFDSSKLDQVPQAVAQGRPEYPFEKRKEGLSGTVTVEFIVDSAGRVIAAHAIGSTERGFESSAVKAVTGWKFKPGRKGGRAVATRMTVDVQFRIN